MSKIKTKFKRLSHFVLGWHSNYDYQHFSLGATLASEPVEQLAEDKLECDFQWSEVEDSGYQFPTYYYREYYLLLYLGFWQLAIGIRTRKN